MGNLGNLERDVLLAIHRQRGAAYAVSIKQEIDEQTGKNTSLRGIHVAADRLEKKGLVVSSRAERASNRGGNPKRVYRIIPKGITALCMAYQSEKRRWANAGLEGLPGPASEVWRRAASAG